MGDVLAFDWTNQNSPVPSKSFGLFTSVSIFTGQSERALSSGHHENPSQLLRAIFQIVVSCLGLLVFNSHVWK